jgi:hypothetical protein
MRIMGLAAFAALLSAAPVGALAGQAAPTGGPARQAAPDDAAAVAAAVMDLLHTLRANDGVPGNGAIRLDPRPLERRESDNPAYATPVTFYALGERESSVAVDVRTVLRAERGNLETARVCATESLRSCTLHDAVAVFAASEPVMQGDSAEVVVTALWVSNLAKQPVQSGTFRITLRRQSGAWRAARTETLVIS